MTEPTLKGRLARYMDPKPFLEGVPDAVKFTSGEFGRVTHDKMKARREIAMKRAECAIRFFCKPENMALLQQRAASVDRSPEGGNSEGGSIGEADESAVGAEGDETPITASTSPEGNSHE